MTSVGLIAAAAAATWITYFSLALSVSNTTSISTSAANGECFSIEAQWYLFRHDLPAVSFVLCCFDIAHWFANLRHSSSLNLVDESTLCNGTFLCMLRNMIQIWRQNGLETKPIGSIESFSLEMLTVFWAYNRYSSGRWVLTIYYVVKSEF